MNQFTTHDSGRREEFATGARRDVQSNKPRYELIPVAALKRLAELYARGDQKYGEHNWQKGMPFSRVVASMLRHVYAYLEGERTEDHLAAVAWNAFTLMAYECDIARGRLDPSLDDIRDQVFTEGFPNPPYCGKPIADEIPLGEWDECGLNASPLKSYYQPSDSLPPARPAFPGAEQSISELDQQDEPTTILRVSWCQECQTHLMQAQGTLCPFCASDLVTPIHQVSLPGLQIQDDS